MGAGSGAARAAERPRTPAPRMTNWRGRHARRPADQYPLAAELVEQEAASDDEGEAPGDLGHAREDGSPSAVVLDGLEADDGHAAGEKRSQVLGPRGRKVPEGEDDLAVAE